MCPRLVKVVKESGLVCVSYGTLNNDPVNVEVRNRHTKARNAVTNESIASKKRRYRRCNC
jgi:hypothetical protein